MGQPKEADNTKAHIQSYTYLLIGEILKGLGSFFNSLYSMTHKNDSISIGFTFKVHIYPH